MEIDIVSTIKLKSHIDVIIKKIIKSPSNMCIVDKRKEIVYHINDISI